MPTTREFITKTTQELQDARTMRGGRRSPGADPHPGEDVGLRVCIDVPGLNRAASQELLWPSHVVQCEGHPHSYVRMPFGQPNAAVTFQCRLRSVLAAQESRHQAVLAEMAMVLCEPPEPLEPPEVQGPCSS